MKLNQLYNYFRLNKEEFFEKLEQCITKNNISTDNESYLTLKDIYEEVRKNEINEKIKITSGRLKIMTEKLKAKVKEDEC
ncbi:hypothetical protein [Arcobacter cloacae]|uniref:Uncharacterized protein n=1 Tax=Arcobacter cloacae TaxID=1054034 RepID=A0A6M8NTQ9_9BACT|nr:hypothetical protein [Arcobacter cloacae]QKF89966.1 hypothetical protein ACLO_1472 [Arcobacter cloacae]RXI40240.1 hypothetical protein CP963_09160 [Arcobacter cloacae]